MRLAQNPQFPANLLERFQCSIQLRLRVSRSDDGAHSRLSFGDRRESNAGCQDALLEELARKLVRQGGIADNYGRDRSLADAGVEPGGLQTLLEIPRIVPKLIDALGL